MSDGGRWRAETARGIVKRIVVEGLLTLATPAHLGGGDGDDLTDMPLLTDAEGGALLTGTSLAGALRTYLRQREHGWRAAEQDSFASVRLFGGRRMDDDGEQSPVIVEDAYGDSPGGGFETRHGNRMDGRSRTTIQGALYDLDLWEAGTIFPLRLELLVLDSEREGSVPEAELRQALGTALAGLHPGDGGIRLGARGRRGFGCVRSSDWLVREYDLRTADGLLGWLREGQEDRPGAAAHLSAPAALGTTEIQDARKTLTIEAEFLLTDESQGGRAGSLLIRSDGVAGDRGPDTISLHTRAPGGGLEPTLPGTTLGGVLAARSRRIIATILAVIGAPPHPVTLCDDLFGANPDPAGGMPPRAGRISIGERLIRNGRTDLVQSRNSIDRFTGGTLPTALFNEQPVFAQAGGTTACLSLQLEDAQEHERGLLVNLLKDLWTSDLPVGGESGVGRGRLMGQWARVSYAPGGVPAHVWEIRRSAEGEAGLDFVGDSADLEAWNDRLWEHLGGKNA